MALVSTAPRSRGLLYAAIPQVLVGSATGVSALLAHYPAAGGQAVRYAIAALLLGGLVVRSRRGAAQPHAWPSARAWLLLSLLALSGQVAFNLLLLAALRRADPATVGSILGCSPVLLALAGPLVTRRRPSGRVLAGSVVVVAGAVAVQGFGRATASGVVLAVGVLLCEAAFSLLALPVLPELGPLRVSAYATALASVQALAYGLLANGPSGVVQEPTVREAFAVGYLGAVATVVAFVLWYTALERVGPAVAGLFAGLVPVSAAASGALLGAGSPTAGEVVGMLLVGAGVVTGMTKPG